MKNTRIHVARWALATSLALLATTTSHALDLTSSYEKARHVDPTLLAAQQALLAGREKAIQGKALLRPQVSLAATVARLDERSAGGAELPEGSGNGGGSRSGNAGEVALQLAQPLVNQKARAEKRQLEQQTGLAEVRHRDAEQELIQRVGETYFNVLLAQEQLRVVQAERAAVTLQRDRAQARFDVGRGKITDVQETQARLDVVVSREVSARSTLALRQTQYRELTGVDADGLAPLGGGFAPSAPQPLDLSTWQARGQDLNTRVQLRRGELAIADAEIAKYKLDARPTLDLVASYTVKAQGSGLSTPVSPDRTRSALVGLQLSVPLYAGGAIDSRLRESVAKKGQAEQELGAALRDMRLQVQDAYLSVHAGVTRIGALEQSVRSAQTALEATTLGRDLGTRTELDVLDAQQRVYTAQLDLAQARNDYLLGRLRLASAAGELQAGDLQALNGYLVH